MEFSILKSQIANRKSKMLCVLCLFLLCLASDAVAQEVTVIMNDGGQQRGSILEYTNKMLKIKTQYGVLKIPAKDILLVDFTSDGVQMSGEAYLHLERGKQLLELGMDNEALKEFMAAIHKSPRYAYAYYELGKFWEKQGQMSEALEYISRAIDLGLQLPGMAEDFMNLADSYYNKDELENAADTYYLLFLTFPEYPEAEYAVYRAGFLFAKELEDNQKALNALEGAVAKFPKSQFAEEGLYQIGRIREEERLPEAAERILLQLLLDFPSSEVSSGTKGQWNDDAHYILAKVYHQERRNEDAIRELEWVMNESADATLIEAAGDMLDQCVWVVYRVSDGLPSDDVRSLARDDNYIWIGTSAGIARFDLDQSAGFQPAKLGLLTGEVLLPGTEIRALAADDLHLWIGTLDSGIKRYNRIEKTWATYTKDEGLSGDRAFAISIDPNSVWVGTALGGVCRYSKYDGSWTNYTMRRDGLASDSILSIASTPDGIWCGTFKEGASFFDRNTGKWQNVIDPAMSGEKPVTSIAAGANYVWFAWYEEFRSGFSRYDALSESWESKEFATWQTDADRTMINLGANDKEMWLGTGSEVLFYDYATSSYSEPFDYPLGLAGQVPKCVLVGDSFVWFATSRGLGRLERGLVERIEQIRQGSEEPEPTIPSMESDIQP